MAEELKKAYELNGVEYSLGTMPPTQGLPVAVKLGNLIGGGAGGIDLGDVMKLKDLNVKDKSTKIPGGVLNALTSLLKTLEADDLMFIVRQCQPYIMVKVDGQMERCNIDKHFNGKMLDLLKVVGQFLKHNFKDFFPASL